jgi:coenzyme PQQ biosynthesis protein PqqD
MSTDSGRRPTVRSGNKGKAPRPGKNGVRLATGVRLARVGAKNELLALTYADGKVQLNESAIAILRLCDGSHSRAEIIAEILQRSRGTTLAADVCAFLDAAQSLGWIIEP